MPRFESRFTVEHHIGEVKDVDDLKRVMDSMRPFIQATVETGGLASGALVGKLLTSQLDDEEETTGDVCFGLGFERWILSGFIDNEIRSSSLKQNRLNITKEGRSTVEKSINVVSLVLDNYTMIPSLDLSAATDFSLGFCMTFWGLHGEDEILKSNLEFLLSYAKARNDRWAVTLLEETLDIAAANGTTDVCSMLIEAGTRTSLLKGIQSATTLDVSDFSDLLGQMNSLRADQLMLLANHSMYNQPSDEVE